MMSLFSPFDLFFYHFSFISVSLFSFVLTMKFWFNSFINSVFGYIFFLMSSFFKSLSNFKFKMFDNIVISLMFTIMVINLFSILPYFFSFTSQVSFNLFWGLSLWLSLFIFSIFNNLKYMLIHFIPEGTPIFLIWFLFFVEFVSNIIRPITLVVRLLANILAGHLLMILLSKMVFIMSPFILLYFFLNLIEFFVSIIQSYIFVTMICLYFSEIV